jgi:hypothetical protein
MVQADRYDIFEIVSPQSFLWTFWPQIVSLRHKGLNILLVTELNDKYAKMGILNNRYRP